MPVLTTLALTVALAASPQTLNDSKRPIAHHLAQTSFQQTQTDFQTRLTQTGSRDSLKNGAVVGAVIGGAATGLLIGYLCHTFNDNDDLPCWQPVLLWTAGGAGAGALIGAGVDALFQRRLGFRATVRF